MRCLVEALTVGAVEGFGAVARRAPAPACGDGSAECRGCIAFVLDLVRVPLKQRCHEDDLQRDGVRPLLVVQRASATTPALAHVHFHPGHVRLRRPRHEHVLVGEAAMSFRASHRVLGTDPNPAMIEANVQLLGVVGRVVWIGHCVESVVVEFGAVVVFARDLGHQFVDESEVLLSVRPLVGVERVEGESGSPARHVFLQGLLFRHPGHQVVDDPETVHWQVTLERMTQNAVVPLRNLGVGAVDHVHDGGRQVAEVLQVALAARVRSVPNLLLQVEPGRGVEEVTIAGERLLQLVREGPCAF